MLPTEPTYLPKRIRRCPNCGDREKVQFIFRGLPPAPASPEEEDRIIFAGCLIEVDENGMDLPSPRWHCPACDISY